MQEKSTKCKEFAFKTNLYKFVLKFIFKFSENDKKNANFKPPCLHSRKNLP